MMIYLSVFSNPSIKRRKRVGNHLLFSEGRKVYINVGKCIPRNRVEYRTVRLPLQKADTVF